MLPAPDTARPAPLLMGIVNVTPDSFSDGGLHATAEAGVAHALRLLDEGADLLDIGGESTRPGAAPVSADAEAARVVPVVEGILEARPRAVISVDTSKAHVAGAALDAGATWVNDVTGLSDPAMAPLCAAHGCRVVVMHMRGTPRTMQRDTHYDDLVVEVEAHLRARVAYAVDGGIDPKRLLVDPGVGFGKAPRDNPRLIAATPRFARIAPVLVGASRKRFIGELTGVPVARDRVHGSVGAALAAAAMGASVLRVHDVAPTRQALSVFGAVQSVVDS